MIFKNSKVYDVLKWLCLVCLPAVNCLWLALSQIWSIPYGEPISLTISAVTAFIGALIGISAIQYNKLKANKVEIVVDEEDNDDE